MQCSLNLAPEVYIAKETKGQNGDIWVVIERNWSPECCYGDNIVSVILFHVMMYICGAKFAEHCSNISRDILASVFLFKCIYYDIITRVLAKFFHRR